MTDLYRFFDANGRLLYVGISLHAAQRASDHRRDKDWWSDVARMDVEHQADRQTALKAELLAIRTEHPIHNIIGATVTPTATPATIPWRCQDCQRQIPIGKEQGYVQLNQNDMWICVCKSCDGGSSSRYWIDAARIHDIADIQQWTNHLFEKNWFWPDDWIDMLRRWCLIRGARDAAAAIRDAKFGRVVPA
jgi:hypothetical protein